MTDRTDHEVFSGEVVTVGVADAYAAATEHFHQAIDATEPAALFAAGMRAICRGCELGVLPSAAQPWLAALVLNAAQALARATVPVMLESKFFEHIGARMPDLLELWCERTDERDARDPAYLPGFIAMVRLLANNVENVSLHAIALRGVPAVNLKVAVSSEADTHDGRSTANAVVSHQPTRH